MKIENLTEMLIKFVKTSNVECSISKSIYAYVMCTFDLHAIYMGKCVWNLSMALSGCPNIHWTTIHPFASVSYVFLLDRVIFEYECY